MLSKQPLEKLLKPTSKTGLLIAVTAPDIYEIRYMPDAAQELLEVMQNDGWKFRRMISLTNSPSENDLEPKYYEIPIFKYLEPVEFIENLLLMNYDDKRRIFWALEERYRTENINFSLIEELDWLKSVQNLLLEKIKLRRGKVSGFILESEMDHYFNGIIKNLEKTKEQIESQNRVGDHDAPLK